LTDTLKFVDHVPRENLVEIYQEADIFCMPSIETYGIAILEAMSSGCAVLVADANGPGEIVRRGTGVKVPLETPDQFIDAYAEYIVQLVDDVVLRCQLAEGAREHVVRHHDWKQLRASLLDIYDEFFQRKSDTVGIASARATPNLLLP
jgi:glycosyltransferase involved in cell wall biosynthesis